MDVINFNEFKKSSASGVRVGDVFTVPDYGNAANFGLDTSLPWVEIQTGGTGHGKSETGVICKGSEIKVRGVSDEFGALCQLIRADRGGTRVSTGSTFFIDPQELLFWGPLRTQQMQIAKNKADEVSRILGKG